MQEIKYLLLRLKTEIFQPGQNAQTENPDSPRGEARASTISYKEILK